MKVEIEIKKVNAEGIECLTVGLNFGKGNISEDKNEAALYLIGLAVHEILSSEEHKESMKDKEEVIMVVPLKKFTPNLN